MKKTIYLILCAAVFALSMVSCDKIDDNGDFGGMWQLTEWKRLPDGQKVCDKFTKPALFYCVQLDLMEFRRSDSHLARFSLRKDSLFIGTVYHGPKDDIVGYDELAPYGVPSDGKFAVDRLTRSTLILRSDTALLTFRKF